MEAAAPVVLVVEEREEVAVGLAGEPVLAALGGLLGALEEAGEGLDELRVGAEGVLFVGPLLLPVPGLLGEGVGQLGDVVEERVLAERVARAGVRGSAEGVEEGEPLGRAHPAGEGAEEGAQFVGGTGLQASLDGLAEHLEGQLLRRGWVDVSHR